MINAREALDDAATHLGSTDAKMVWLTEAMIRHWQADALEAAALECDKAAEFEEANEHDFDSLTIPMHAVAALRTTGAAVRKIKPEAGFSPPPQLFTPPWERR